MCVCVQSLVPSACFLPFQQHWHRQAAAFVQCLLTSLLVACRSTISTCFLLGTPVLCCVRALLFAEFCFVSRLVAQETTNDVFNHTLFQLVTPQSILEWARNLVTLLCTVSRSSLPQCCCCCFARLPTDWREQALNGALSSPSSTAEHTTSASRLCVFLCCTSTVVVFLLIHLARFVAVRCLWLCSQWMILDYNRFTPFSVPVLYIFTQ